jgi:hypothetical protein
MTKCDIAREYRRKYGMEMPSLKLARIMYAENNLTFKDVSIVNGALTGSIVFTINATNTITNQTVAGKTQEVITSNYIKPPAVYQFAIKGDVQGLAEVSKETPDQVFKGKALYITI